MTKRVEEALGNPYVRCLSHPKGRYINRRPENALDLDRVFRWRGTEVALEVNGLPSRLDLSGEPVRDALRAGVPIVCSTDAHSVRGLDNMTLSVATARRGWATAAHVVDSYEPATGCARRFWFEPTEQELTSGSRFDRLCTAGHQPRSCSGTKGAMRYELTARSRATGIGHDGSCARREDVRGRQHHDDRADHPRLLLNA